VRLPTRILMVSPKAQLMLILTPVCVWPCPPSTQVLELSCASVFGPRVRAADLLVEALRQDPSPALRQHAVNGLVRGNLQEHAHINICRPPVREIPLL
jgi:hypothetical protein